MKDPQPTLVRNLGYGAVIGAGVGLLGALTGPVRADFFVVVGQVLGGAFGGAVVFVLAMALWRLVAR